MTQENLILKNVEPEAIFSRFESIERALNDLAQRMDSVPKSEECEYYTRKDVAKKLKISLVTLHDWTRKGVVAAYKMGNRVYYKPAEVEAAMERKGTAV